MGWACLAPIAANVVALVWVGWLYNKLTGHSWPHRAILPPAPVRATMMISYTRENIEAVLSDWDEVLDVDVDDLYALYQALDRRVLHQGARR